MTKKPSRSVISLALLSVVMIAYSCTFGLESLGSARDGATVAISIPSPVSGKTGSAGRAIAPGATNLYIRALGGPDGTSAKGYFGPYATTPGSTFKTKDIEPGSYDGFVLLVTSSPVDDRACQVNGEATTFGAVFSLPDAAFSSAIAADSATGLTIFDSALDNAASYAILGPTPIKTGKGNALTATLKPATSATVSATKGGTLSSGDAGTYRAFARVTALKALAGASESVKLTISNPETSDATLTAFAAWRADGSPVPDSARPSAAIAAGKSVECSVATGGDDTCFVYVEFAAPSLRFEFSKPAASPTNVPVPAGKTITVSFSGYSGHAAKRALFEVYAASGVKYNESSLDYDIIGAPVAFGAVTLDGTGTGSDYVYDASTGEPKAFDTGTYYISAFVDMNGTYDDLTDSPNLEVTGSIIPNKNDSVPVKKAYACAVDTTAMTYTFDSSSFVTFADNVLFVGTGDGGNGDRKDRQESLENAITTINNAAAGDVFIVYLKEPVSTANSMTIKGGMSLSLTSADSSPKTILFTGTASSFITGQSTATITLRNCVIDGNDANRSFSLVDIAGTFNMETGSGLQYTKSSGAGGGVYMKSGSTFNMRGGTIRNCQASLGGGVYMYATTAPCVFTMTGGEILNCSATDNGGGICAPTGLQTASILITNAAITNCTALRGAGAYLGAKAEMELSGGGLVDNSQLLANGQGGGVYVSSNAKFTLAGGTITGTTSGSPSYGGGVYVDANGKFYITLGSASTITDCVATSGGGLYVVSGGLMNDNPANVAMLDELFELQIISSVQGNDPQDYVFEDYP